MHAVVTTVQKAEMKKRTENYRNQSLLAFCGLQKATIWFIQVRATLYTRAQSMLQIVTKVA